MDLQSTTSGAVSGAVAAMPAILLGAHVDALVLGMMAALFVSIMTETIDSRAKAAASVLLASLMAGYGSPVAAQWVAVNYPTLFVLETHGVMRLLMALIIGAATPSVVPIAIRIMNRKGDAL